MSGIINSAGSKSGIIGLVDLGDNVITRGVFDFPAHSSMHHNASSGSSNLTLTSGNYYLLTARVHHTTNMNEQYLVLTEITTNSSGTVGITQRANNFAGSPHWIVSSSTTNQITIATSHSTYAFSWYLMRMGKSGL